MDKIGIDMEHISARLEALEDREQIRDVLSRWSRAADRTDVSVAKSLMWPDAELILSFAQGTAADFMDGLFGSYVGAILAATHHMLGNMIIDVKGATAYSETYAIAHHRSHPNPESNAAIMGAQNFSADEAHQEMELIIGLRYLDKLEKREGVWKLIRRRLVFDWSQKGVYSGISTGGLYDGTVFRGERSNDPLYDFGAL